MGSNSILSYRTYEKEAFPENETTLYLKGETFRSKPNIFQKNIKGKIKTKFSEKPL
jgi:hypothetical protein